MLHAVILCGGRGERFWPRSRRARPKQFINLFGRRSLTQATSERIRTLCPLSRQLFVAPEEFKALVREQVRPAHGNVILEPVGRNTAPAIALAAVYLRKRDPDAVMVVLPADHLIQAKAEFLRCVRLATDLAGQGLFVTFGITPTRPDTGYGYIQLGHKVTSIGNLCAFKVVAFREKPDSMTAQGYLNAGSYLWNSGMFVWRADVYLRAVRQFLPDFYPSLERFAATIGRRGEARALERLYGSAPTISVDYAIMEKVTNVAAVRATFDWDDVGSWLSLERHLAPDPDGNVASGVFVGRGVHGCVILSDAGLVAGLGLRDMVIVRSQDAVLVAHKDALRGIKDLLADISRNPRTKGSL